MANTFYNPYNFVSTPSRKIEDPFCGDYDPSCPKREEDHSRYWASRYIGTIPVKLKTQTPLFITDPDSETLLGEDHRCYDCLDHIPATALKGMISSAYECITNSRFRVFSKEHENPLTYRSDRVRKVSQASPLDCLDETLRPAKMMKDLSPADRLFGWVSQGKTEKGGSAWRGKVRISDADFVPNDEVQTPVLKFDAPMPLSILGAPKPAQARFYLGDKDGRPQRDGISKDSASYQKGRRLRGRKVYLHHTLHFLSRDQKKSYWDPESDDRSIDVREYSRFSGTDKIRTNQNRSITGWIPQQREFRFNISFDNLTEEELGALLTLLTLGDDACYFRLGFAKPLGLGSVRLSIEWDEESCVSVCTGADMGARYKALGEFALPRLTRAEANRIIRTYQKVMVKAYGNAEDADDGEELSDLPWERDKKRYEFLKLVDNPDDISALKDAWVESLDAIDAMKRFPKDPKPNIDGLTWLVEFAEDPEFDAMRKLYDDFAAIAKERAERRKNDHGWGKLPFIAELKQSMHGFDTDDRVHYPRSSDAENGYEWFMANENKRRLSLPLLSENGKPGKPLEGF